MVLSGVPVTGLAELRRDLARAQLIEDGKDLRNGLKDAAGIVATQAKVYASVFSMSAAQTIRPVSGGNKTYVAGGKAKLPWYGWADFGSRSPVTGNPRTVGPWTGSGVGPRVGRFIYRALEDKDEQVAEAVRDAVSKALFKLGL